MKYSEGSEISSLAVKGVVKQFSNERALDEVSLDVEVGEFLTLLGPSGSGKTTLLRVIAGFVRPDAGAVWLDGQDITRLPPHRRGIGMMFQNYALFPHKTVAENVAYPLWLRRVPRAERDKRVTESLRLVQLDKYGDRSVKALSGGQKQRVALARATVFKPRILLMDEPLSALDKRLREQMQVELRKLHQKLGMTTVCVTHDQREALTMSDRIAVMEDGQIRQSGPPRKIYERPNSIFVANFVGESCLIPVQVERGKPRLNGTPIRVNGHSPSDGNYFLMIRPEKVRLLAETDTQDFNCFKGHLTDFVYEGESVALQVDLGGSLNVRMRTLMQESLTAAGRLPEIGDEVTVGLHQRDSVLVPGDRP